MTVIDDVINDLKQYIEYQIEEGETETEIKKSVIDALSASNVAVKKTPAPLPKTTMTKQKENTTSVNKQTVITATTLEQIAEEIKQCTKCDLHKSRTNVVPGHGNPNPEIMFIGEAPGAEEDKQGMPFVGRSGQFLTKMIIAMGFTREDVFIGNILKCRPPANRTPTSDEIEICIPYLKQQIAILKPKAIIALGSTAVKGLLGDTPAISKIRGEWRKFEGVPLMPTFHPAYILRNQSKKKELWHDLKKVLSLLGRTPPPVK